VNPNPPEDFAVFILSHGRAHTVVTMRTLASHGYTGPVYIIIDNEDAQADEYRALYGAQVIMFDKQAIARTLDEGDNFNDRRSILYARHACWAIAQNVGVQRFLQLDDDYHWWAYKFAPDLSYKDQGIKNLNALFNIVLRFHETIPAVTVAFAQGGDFIGGATSTASSVLHLKRKAMNTFFCRVDRPFQFRGRFNEDVNTYVSLGNRGTLFFTVTQAAITQHQTQTNPGGITDLYLKYGSYVKAFMTVMHCPSSVKVYTLGHTNPRIHHRITWIQTVPRILPESVRRRSQSPSAQ